MDKKTYEKPEIEIIVIEKNIFLENSAEIDFGYLIGEYQE